MINPAFSNFKDELSLIGEMVIGYGELDISFSMICGLAIGRKMAVLRACQKVRSETSKIDVAAALAIDAFDDVGMLKEFDVALEQLKFCTKIRNAYAHSQWAEIDGELKFLNADTAFKRPLQPVKWLPIDIDLLRKQEAFFENTRMWLIWLELALGSIQLKRPLTVNKPPKIQEPTLHKTLPTPNRIPSKKGPKRRP